MTFRRSSLICETSMEGDIATIAVSGKISVATAPELESAIDQAFADGARNARVDLSKVDYISSAGLRVLVHMTKGALAHDGVLVIVKPSGEVYEVLEVTGLVSVLKIEK